LLFWRKLSGITIATEAAVIGARMCGLVALRGRKKTAAEAAVLDFLR
jgi:hypothetical protein